MKKDNNVVEINDLEALLNRNMVPVFPSQEFVANLRNSLLSQIPQEVEVAISTQRRNLHTGLIVTGGILGGILIIVSGVRGIVSLMGIFALLINWFRQYSQQTPTIS